MVPKWYRIDVDATSSRRIDVNTTSFLRHVPAGFIYNELNHSTKEEAATKNNEFNLINLIFKYRVTLFTSLRRVKMMKVTLTAVFATWAILTEQT